MRRREFITLLGGASAGWPLTARAQRTAIPVIGFLGSAAADGYRQQLTGFREGLDETGFTEGHNVHIEYRWAENQYDILPILATDLIRLHVASLQSDC